MARNYNLRPRCKPKDSSDHRDDEQDEQESRASGSPPRPSVSSVRKNPGESGGQQKDEGGKSSSQGVQRQYCAQKCFLGIVQGSRLDKKCPNASLHPRVNQKHSIDQQNILNLVQKQLADDLDHHCEPLGLQGREELFLESHGYVFVGKGTVQAFVPDLLHEGEIYQRLGKHQGTAVPVYLGNIDLK